MTSIEAYAAPRTLAAATQAVAAGGATALAGGTDLMLQIRSGARAVGPLLLNLRRVAEMRGISRADEMIHLGALTTVTDVLESEDLRAWAPLLPAVADCFASGQVRNTATLGGNICNASPAGDMIIPLILLDAAVDLAGWHEGQVTQRSLPLGDFFEGPGRCKIRPTEILTAIRFPVPAAGFVGRFHKFGTRPSLDIAVVSVGIGCRRDGDRLHDVRVAFGAVAPIPLRARETEAALEGQRLDQGTIARALERADVEIAPISDVRASAWYRRELIQTLTRRLLQNVAQAGD